MKTLQDLYLFSEFAAVMEFNKKPPSTQDSSSEMGSSSQVAGTSKDD